MRERATWLVAGCVCAGFLLCGAARPGEKGTAKLAAADVVGTWSLQEVDGQDPAAADIKTLVLAIGADGRWTARVKTMRGRWLGRSVVFEGTWSLGNGVVRFTRTVPPTPDRTTGWLDREQLIIDPDLIVRSNGWTTPASCAYRREGGPTRE